MVFVKFGIRIALGRTGMDINGRHEGVLCLYCLLHSLLQYSPTPTTTAHTHTQHKETWETATVKAVDLVTYVVHWTGCWNSEKEAGGKTSEIWIQSGASITVWYQSWFLSFDKCTVVMQNVTMRGNLRGGQEELITHRNWTVNLKLFQNKDSFNKKICMYAYQWYLDL